MKFQFQRKGLIFNPSKRFNWMNSHAQVPTIVEFENYLRIYFTCRPAADNVGSFVSCIAYIDVDKNNPSEILSCAEQPVIELGDTGTFDQYGTMPGSFINADNKLWMYYTGWSRELDLPYSTAIGIALSNDNGKKFDRIAKGPILSKSLYDPYLVNGPFVMKENNKWHMWYSSCHNWVDDEGKKDPIYSIKHAISEDGINWHAEEANIISDVFENEAQNRPMVFKHEGKYFMIFSFRKGIDFRNGINGYRIGGAFSDDLKNWKRDDELFELTGKQEMWEIEMNAYPYIFKMNDKLLLFYNGNEFGKYGFGWAVLTNVLK